MIRRWADFGLGPFTDIPASRDAIAHLLPLPHGGLAFAAADPGWGTIAPDGTLAIAPRPPGGDFRNTGVTLALSADGTQVLFTLRAGGAPLVFDPLTGSLSAWGGEAGFTTARDRDPAPARARLAQFQPPAPRQPAAAPGRGRIRAAAWRSWCGEDGFLLGTDNHLRLYDAQRPPGRFRPDAGRRLGRDRRRRDGRRRARRRHHPLVPLRGRRAARAGRAVRPCRDAALGALDARGACSTTRANGGQELVGVHLNGGRNQTPEWASFQQAYRALYAPRAVRGRIAGDFAPAQERLAQLGRSAQPDRPVAAAGPAAASAPWWAEECQPIGLGRARAARRGARAAHELHRDRPGPGLRAARCPRERPHRRARRTLGGRRQRRGAARSRLQPDRDAAVWQRRRAVRRRPGADVAPARRAGGAARRSAASWSWRSASTTTRCRDARPSLRGARRAFRRRCAARGRRRAVPRRRPARAARWPGDAPRRARRAGGRRARHRAGGYLHPVHRRPRHRGAARQPLPVPAVRRARHEQLRGAEPARASTMRRWSRRWRASARATPSS